MTVCGVVAEYNPFHAGHAHHLAETRRRLGADTAIVCAMSGNFVQRGDLAVLEKYRRAEAAVRCGADLVLETPLSCAPPARRMASGWIGLCKASSAHRYSTASVLFGLASSAPDSGSVEATACCTAAA